MKDTLLVLHPGVETTDGASTKAQASPADTGQQSGSTSSPPQASGTRGLRLALLDNTKVNAIELLNAIAKRLEALGDVTTRSWRKRHAGESGERVIPEILQWQPDLVLTGLGD